MRSKRSRPQPSRRSGTAPLKVAVVAHSGKTLGGGLSELHGALVAAGVSDPLWFEVPKSRKAPKRVRQAIKQGATLIFVWGGDGMVQRCIDAAAGSKAAIAIVPAGTANLLASNLGIPKDIAKCVEVGLHGTRQPIDVGKVNGERFAVMAGVGFDAMMIRDADDGLKARIGRLAYVWTGAKQLDAPRFGVRIQVDGEPWFTGRAACVLFGNVGSAFGGLTFFENARLDDGRIDFGVVTAKGALEWARTLARTVAGDPEASKFVKLGTGRKIKVRLERPLPYEVDGSARPATDRLDIKVQSGAVTVCVPQPDPLPARAVPDHAVRGQRAEVASPSERRPRRPNAYVRGWLKRSQVPQP